METIAELTSRHFGSGRLRWIGIRAARKSVVSSLEYVEIGSGGLTGDHHSSGGKRAVTLIQHEHLRVISALLGDRPVDPALLRRNLVVSGINLLGLKRRRFHIGSALLEGTGICAPCSRMEKALGHGGYTALRGHGGITASVISTGTISLGDNVSPV